jgi:hypothetical protein
MAPQAAIVRTNVVARSIHEEVDQDQYNHWYTQKPAQEILAHHALLVVVMPARVPQPAAQQDRSSQETRCRLERMLTPGVSPMNRTSTDTHVGQAVRNSTVIGAQSSRWGERGNMMVSIT